MADGGLPAAGEGEAAAAPPPAAAEVAALPVVADQALAAARAVDVAEAVAAVAAPARPAAAAAGGGPAIQIQEPIGPNPVSISESLKTTLASVGAIAKAGVLRIMGIAERANFYRNIFSEWIKKQAKEQGKDTSILQEWSVNVMPEKLRERYTSPSVDAVLNDFSQVGTALHEAAKADRATSISTLTALWELLYWYKMLQQTYAQIVADPGQLELHEANLEVHEYNFVRAYFVWAYMYRLKLQAATLFTRLSAAGQGGVPGYSPLRSFGRAPSIMAANSHLSPIYEFFTGKRLQSIAGRRIIPISARELVGINYMVNEILNRTPPGAAGGDADYRGDVALLNGVSVSQMAACLDVPEGGYPRLRVLQPASPNSAYELFWKLYTGATTSDAATAAARDAAIKSSRQRRVQMTGALAGMSAPAGEGIFGSGYAGGPTLEQAAAKRQAMKNATNSWVSAVRDRTDALVAGPPAIRPGAGGGGGPLARVLEEGEIVEGVGAAGRKRKRPEDAPGGGGGAASGGAGGGGFGFGGFGGSGSGALGGGGAGGMGGGARRTRRRRHRKTRRHHKKARRSTRSVHRKSRRAHH